MVVEAPPLNEERPVTVRVPKVPTEVKEELTTPDPRVVADRTPELLIS